MNLHTLGYALIALFVSLIFFTISHALVSFRPDLKFKKYAVVAIVSGAIGFLLLLIASVFPSVEIF